MSNLHCKALSHTRESMLTNLVHTFVGPNALLWDILQAVMPQARLTAIAHRKPSATETCLCKCLTGAMSLPPC